MLAKPHPSEVFAGSDVGGAHEVYEPVLPLEEAQLVARVVSHVNSHCLYKCPRALGKLTSPPTDFHLFKYVVSPVSITELSPPPLLFRFVSSNIMELKHIILDIHVFEYLCS